LKQIVKPRLECNKNKRLKWCLHNSAPKLAPWQVATYRHKGSLTYFVKEHFPCSKVWKLEMKTLSLFLFLFLSIKGIQWASINYLGWVIKTYPIQIKFNMNYRFILIINKTLKGLARYLTHTHVTLLIRIIWILFCVFFYNFFL
jgi:hypothetical protein